MNPELLERFLAKKAKKLGISVEELKARGTSPVSSTQTDSVQTSMQSTVSQTGCAEQTFQQSVLSQQPATPSESQYTQQYSQQEYVQDHIAQTNYGMQPETVKTEIPSYVLDLQKWKKRTAIHKTVIINRLINRQLINNWIQEKTNFV